MSRRKVRKLGGLNDFSPNYHGQDLTSLGGLLPPRGYDQPLTNGSTGGVFNPPSGGSGSGNGSLPGYNISDDPLNSNSSWSAILQGVSQDQFADFLSSLGVGYDKGMDDASKANWAQALLNAMLKHYQDQEQRAYDKSVRDEQRVYDSPTNQLARLMGAGISRDAAIQMLAGGSESGLIGSASAGSEGAGSPADASANMLNSKLGIANAVFGGLSAISSLVGVGFSIPQAVQQTRFLKAQNYMTQGQVRAYESAGNAYHILKTAGVSADAFTSLSNVGNALTDLARSGNADAANFIASGGLKQMHYNAPFASNVIKNLGLSERSYSDHDTAFRNAQRLTVAEAALKEVQPNLVNKEIALYDEQIKNLNANTDYQHAQSNLSYWSAVLAKEQGLTEGINRKYIQSQTRSVDLSNNLESAFQNASYGGQSGLEMYSDYRIQQLFEATKRISTKIDNESWNKEVQTFLASQDNMRAVYELGTLYTEGAIGAYNESSDKSKNLLGLCKAFQECGLIDYVNAMANSETAGNFHAGQFGGSTSTEGFDVLKNFDKPDDPTWKKILNWKPFDRRR